MNEPNVFSQAELSCFLTHIDIPPSHKLHDKRCCGDAALDLHLLQQVQVHMLSTVPFEDLVQHYSSNRMVDISPRAVYNKIMGNDRGRGGFCMELNIFYMHMLIALGFKTHMLPVRVWRDTTAKRPGHFSGWVHVVIVVTLPNGQYIVDVAFGGVGPTAPMLLIEGQSQRNLGSQDVRLVRKHLPGQSDRTENSKHWVYEHRNGPAQDWNNTYAFAETEVLPNDIEVMNWFVCTSPGSRMPYQILAVKFLRRPVPTNASSEDRDQEIYGKNVLAENTIVKQNLGDGKSNVMQTITSETERVKAMEHWFGIVLTNDEAAAIRGYNSELRSANDK